MQNLQVDQPIALQSRVQTLSWPKGLATPLAPVPEKPLETDIVQNGSRPETPSEDTHSESSSPIL